MKKTSTRPLVRAKSEPKLSHLSLINAGKEESHIGAVNVSC